MSRATRIQVILGIGLLLFGTLVYVIDRPPGEAFVPSALSLFGLGPRMFGPVGQSLPTFAHVFAFSLLTMAFIGSTRRADLIACAGWFVVDSAFELGQHPAIAPWLSRLIPSWFENIPILARTEGYFLYGTFDLLDLLSIALGAFAAYVVMQRTRRRRIHDE